MESMIDEKDIDLKMRNQFCNDYNSIFTNHPIFWNKVEEVFYEKLTGIRCVGAIYMAYIMWLRGGSEQIKDSLERYQGINEELMAIIRRLSKNLRISFFAIFLLLLIIVFLLIAV